MADEKLYRDVANMIGEETDDAWVAMAESYAFVTHTLVAVLQKWGSTRLPDEWYELAQGFVVISEKLKDGTVRISAVRSGEVRSDSAAGAEALREKWERMYKRVDEGPGS